MSDIGSGRGTILPPTEIQATVPISRGNTPLPTTLLSLPSGTVISGTVLGRDTRGLTQLDTKHGIINIKPDISLVKYLTRGTDVMLRLEVPGGGKLGSAEPTARILTVNGTPIAKLTDGHAKPEPAVLNQTTPNAQPGKGAPASPTTYSHLKPALQQQGLFGAPQQGNTATAQATPPRSALLAGTSLFLSTESLTPRQLQGLQQLVPALKGQSPQIIHQLTQQGIQIQARVIASGRATPPATPQPAPSPSTTTASPGSPAGTSPAPGIATPATSAQPTASGNTPQPGNAPSPVSTSQTAATPSTASGNTQGAAPAATSQTPQSTAASTTSATPPNVTPRATTGQTPLQGVVQYVRPAPPGQPTGTTTQPLTPGTVPPPPTGNQPAPIMILDTHLGSFRLPVSLPPIPAGSTITLDIMQVTPRGDAGATLVRPGLGIPVDERPPAPLRELSIRWESMEEVLKQAQATPASQAAISLMETLPTPSIRMTTTTLFFLAALQGGSLPMKSLPCWRTHAPSSCNV